MLSLELGLMMYLSSQDKTKPCTTYLMDYVLRYSPFTYILAWFNWITPWLEKREIQWPESVQQKWRQHFLKSKTTEPKYIAGFCSYFGHDSKLWRRLACSHDIYSIRKYIYHLLGSYLFTDLIGLPISTALACTLLAIIDVGSELDPMHTVFNGVPIREKITPYVIKAIKYLKRHDKLNDSVTLDVINILRKWPDLDNPIRKKLEKVLIETASSIMLYHYCVALLNEFDILEHEAMKKLYEKDPHGYWLQWRNYVYNRTIAQYSNRGSNWD